MQRTKRHVYSATIVTNQKAYSVRDRLLDRWNYTQQSNTLADPKRVYYLSLEFLLGRTLDNAMLNLQVKDQYSSGLGNLGFRVEDFLGEETDAALGNGGLGRLAACYMGIYLTFLQIVRFIGNFELSSLGLWNPLHVRYFQTEHRRWTSN